MNKITKFLAVALAACGTVALAACGSSTNKTTTSPNWNAQVNVDDTLVADYWLNNAEVATYKIAFTDGSNGYYSLAYDEDAATYTTQFYATTFDWSDESVPESYRSASEDKETIYVYTTSLSVSGSITHKSTKESVEFTDKVETVAYFRLADDNLQPVYSYQSIESTFPANLQANSLSSSYRKMHRVYETNYNKKCSQAIIATTYSDDDYYEAENHKGSETSTVGGLNSTGYSLFDTNMLATALRSFSYGSHTFSVFIPINGGVSTCNSSSSSSKKLDKTDDSQNSIISALNGAGDYLFVGETDDDGDTVYKYNSVSLNLNAEMSGSSNSYWFVNVAGNQVNAGRAVMVRMETPIYFSAGTLTYNLSSLTISKR